MKVFISGVAGFLGSHLADAFLARGDRVVGCDNLIGGEVENVPKGVEFHPIDCNNLGALRILLRDVDVLYHAAATAHVGLSVFSPYENAVNGYAASAAMMSAAAACRVRRFVFLSSADRYGAQEVPFVETMPTKPEDPYGIGKVAAEDLLKLIGRVHGMEWAIGVPHCVIGPRQRYIDPFRNVVSIMINRMLRGRQPILYGDGEQVRCFSFVSDVVPPLVRLGVAEAAVGEVFNLGPDDEPITINDLARAVARILDFDLHPIYVPGRPQEVRFVNCSADKARRLLDYAPKVRLREGLRGMVDWIRAHGPRPFEYRFGLEIVNDKTPRTWSDRLL